MSPARHGPQQAPASGPSGPIPLSIEGQVLSFPVSKRMRGGGIIYESSLVKCGHFDVSYTEIESVTNALNFLVRAELYFLHSE